MRKILYFAILVLFIASCTGTKSNKDKNVITVTILPQKYFVEQIAGNTFPINVILPPGASPEHYEPTPKQLRDLSQSFIYFYVGHLGFEKPWMKKFYDNAPGVDYISCSKGIDLLEGGHEHCSADDQDHVHRHGTDPHIWTSPENVKTMSRTIFTELKNRFPDKENEFKANLDLFISRIDSLDFYIRATLSDSIRRDFMIFHPSLGYYANDYHLNQHSIEYEGKSPGAAHIRKMVDLAHERNIKTIFIQTQFESEKAEAIAREINAEMVVVDPLAEDWLAEMYSITEKLNKSLSR
jgi:zinc transport system substrate-binding protein